MEQNTQIDEKILKSLFVSPKTTGELVEEMAYKKYRYNNISTYLKKLEKMGFIKGEKKKVPGVPSTPPTVYDLVYDPAVVTQILTKYHRLIPYARNNDIILDMLVTKYCHAFFIDNRPTEDEKTMLKQNLLHSYTLFCQILTNEFDVIKQSFKFSFITFQQTFEQIFDIPHIKTNDSIDPIEPLLKADIYFCICTLTDALKNHASKEDRSYLESVIERNIGNK